MRGSREGGPLIIAYGNDLRGDDGAAHVAARHIERNKHPGLQVLRCHQLTPELAELVAKHDPVVFIDARRPDGSDQVEVHELEPDPALPELGHVASPEYLLALSAALYERTPRTWLITIPTVSMSFGSKLSKLAEASARIAADAAIQLIQKRPQ